MGFPAHHDPTIPIVTPRSLTYVAGPISAGIWSYIPDTVPPRSLHQLH